MPRVSEPEDPRLSARQRFLKLVDLGVITPDWTASRVTEIVGCSFPYSSVLLRVLRDGKTRRYGTEAMPIALTAEDVQAYREWRESLRSLAKKYMVSISTMRNWLLILMRGKSKTTGTEMSLSYARKARDENIKGRREAILNLLRTTDKTYAEIGAEFGISRQRVGQIAERTMSVISGVVMRLRKCSGCEAELGFSGSNIKKLYCPACVEKLRKGESPE